ncbi:LysR family transcriptional regulator [Streptomyces sp. NPDC050095]|uniref:LysR family transcriptional regulator n=1 Tax=unclassified Streptomyces TaxID=2593676 RepID=UPI00344AACFF
MQHDIEVKLLRTLLAVVNEDGFSRAARSLHVTQPTVSQQINRLEAVIHAPLFHSTRRPLRLTAAGREMVAHARRVILLNSQVLDKLSALRSQETFSMGCSIHFTDGLPAMITRLAEERPQSRCSMVTGLSATLADQVSSGELEAAILLGIRTERSEMLGRLRLGWFGQVSQSPDERVPVALVGDRSALNMRIVETLAEHAVPWRSVPWYADPLSVRAAVGAGMAYTALAENAHHSHTSLRPAAPGVLGPAPVPLPVYLAISPSVGEAIGDAVHAAARAIVADAPLSPP